MKQGFLLIFSALMMTACTRSQSFATPPVELKHFALNSVEDVRATTARLVGLPRGLTPKSPVPIGRAAK